MDFDIENLGKTVQIVEGGPDQEISQEDLDALTWGLMRSYYPQYDLDPESATHPMGVWKTFKRDRGFIEEFIKSPDCVLAKDGDRIIGLSMIKKMDVSASDGRPYVLYSISSVLTEYRGYGLYEEMYKRKDEKCREKFPDAIVVAMSKTPAVIKTALKHGFIEISHFEWKERMGKPRDDEHVARLEKQGWVCFLRDDREKKDVGEIIVNTEDAVNTISPQ